MIEIIRPRLFPASIAGLAPARTGRFRQPPPLPAGAVAGGARMMERTVPLDDFTVAPAPLALPAAPPAGFVLAEEAGFADFESFYFTVSSSPEGINLMRSVGDWLIRP